MDWHISPVVAEAVAQAAQETGVAQLSPAEMAPERVHERTERYIYEGELAWLPQEGQDYGKLSIDQEALEVHRRYQGVIQVYTKVPIKDEFIYRQLYAPEAVAEVIQKVLADPMAAYDYTSKNNLVAIVTDGSAVLGLGNIGPRAALPVMEGKAVLFKTFGGVEAFPICIGTQDTDLVVRLVETISPAFGGINLEDISSPRCFEVERTLTELLDIPVFHDDQHGTAVVALAGLLNALKIVDRSLRHRHGQNPPRGGGAKPYRLRHQGCGVQRAARGHEPHQGGTGGDYQPRTAARQPGGGPQGGRSLHRTVRPQRP